MTRLGILQVNQHPDFYSKSGCFQNTVNLYDWRASVLQASVIW